jgi:hypothetical protein
MKIPLVKEHGAWFVFFFSAASGVLTGILSLSEPLSHEVYLYLLSTLAGITLLINSKAPFVSMIRSGRFKRDEAVWLALFLSFGLLLLIPFLKSGLIRFLPFSLPAAAYFILLYLNKEHLVVTELIGFSLLTIAAPVTYFVITGSLSLQLYAAVFIFFSAGVFKVRVRLKRTPFFRIVMALYCMAAAGMYLLMGITPLILLPLIDNILFSFRPRDEKLKVTGNTELIKGAVFLVLLGLFFAR